MRKIIFVTMFTALFFHKAAWTETTKDKPFENVHLFKNLSRSELLPVMNFMRASLGVHCDYCHVVGEKGWEWGNDAKRPKARAREMIRMVTEINKMNFKGKPLVSCFTCHQGRIRPNGTPPLPQQEPPYPTPIREPEKANIEINQILDQYSQATGSERRSAILKARSLIFKGTTDETWKRKVVAYEVHYKAPDKWLIKKNLEDGVRIQVLNGTNGWVQEGSKTETMDEQQVAIFRDAIDSLQLFPALPAIKPVAVIKRTINDRPALAVEYKLSDQVSEFFYFDAETHLLVGRKRYTVSPVGSIPHEVNYENYKELEGAKIPYTLRSNYVDPWIGGTFSFTEIVLNPPLEDAEFQMPSGKELSKQ